MGGGLEQFSVSPSPLLVLDLIGTWLGLGLGVFGTKGLGTGLDNRPGVDKVKSLRDGLSTPYLD